MGQHGSKSSTPTSPASNNSTTNTAETNQSSRGQESIKKKLLTSKVHRPHFESDAELLDAFSFCLSSVDELKKRYLNLNWMETVEVYREMEKQAMRAKQQQSKSNNIKQMFRSQSESVPVVSNQSTENPIFIEEDEDLEDSEEWIDEGRQIDLELLRKNTIKIKIVITEIAKTEMERNIRKLVSPVMSNFRTFPEFGMFHSAIMIGPWYLDWNNSSLCVPRKCVSQAALLTADIDSIQSTEKIEDIVAKLANLIVHWNTTMKYKDSNGKKGEEGNCQDFVDAILAELGLSLNVSGPLSEFLQKMRTKGTSKMQFKVDDDFRLQFGLTSNKLTFKTHDELDIFTHSLFDKDPEFDTNYKQEYAMLKNFDRAFWLRHLKANDDEKWKPHYKQMVDDEGDTIMDMDCPFGDPRETYSFRFINN